MKNTDVILRGGWPHIVLDSGRILPVAAGGADGGGDGGGEGGSGAAGGTGDPGAAAAGGSGTGGGGTGDGSPSGSEPGSSAAGEQQDPPAKVEMTQAELDELITKRLGRAKSQWESEAKTAADRAKMDEAQRLAAEKADADARAETAEKTANDRIVTAEAKVLATTLGVAKESLPYLVRMADLSAVEVDDDGEPDAKALKAAVDKVLEDVPALKGDTKPAPRSGGPLNGGDGNEKVESLEDAINARLAKTG